MQPIIIIDPGHGGGDPGAVGQTGLREADVAVAIADLAVGFANAGGLDARLTHHGEAIESEKNADLRARAHLATKAAAACLVSIHCNSVDRPEPRGFEIWTTPGQTAADSLATAITTAVTSRLPDLRLRGDFEDGDPDREKWLLVLRSTPVPAVLVETEFISNPEAERLLASFRFRRQMAAAIVDGIHVWLDERRTV